MLDVHRLRIFRAVVAAGSVHAAAANLGYTPSAVSQQLAALQRETGLVLFRRAGRGISPTDAGLTLAEHADAVLARLGETEAAIGDLRSGRAGALSIAYFASVGGAWLPHVVRHLIRGFPDVRLDLRLREELPALPEERSDIQLIATRQDLDRLDGAGFAAHHLVDDPYVAVFRLEHPLAQRSEVELAELQGEHWVDNDSSHGWCRRQLLEACRAAGVTPRFQVEAHDYATAIAFVAAGIGITVLPGLAARSLPPEVTAVPVVRPAPVRSIRAVVRESVRATPAAAEALSELRNAARGLAAPPAGGL